MKALVIVTIGFLKLDLKALKSKTVLNIETDSFVSIGECLEYIKRNLERVDCIVVDSNNGVQQALTAADIDYVTVVPDKRQKKEWIGRCICEGYELEEMIKIAQLWDNEIEKISSVPYGDKLYRLDKDESLSDIIPIIEYDKGFTKPARKAVVIAAFPLSGKTYASEHSGFWKCLDLDLNDFLPDGTKAQCSDFPNNYIQEIKNNIYKYDIIFVSADLTVQEAMRANQISFTTIFPKKDSLHGWIANGILSGKDKSYIDFITDQCKATHYLGTSYYVLGDNCHVSDIIATIMLKEEHLLTVSDNIDINSVLTQCYADFLKSSFKSACHCKRLELSEHIFADFFANKKECWIYVDLGPMGVSPLKHKNLQNEKDRLEIEKDVGISNIVGETVFVPLDNHLYLIKIVEFDSISNEISTAKNQSTLVPNDIYHITDMLVSIMLKGIYPQDDDIDIKSALTQGYMDFLKIPSPKKEAPYDRFPISQHIFVDFSAKLKRCWIHVDLGPINSQEEELFSKDITFRRNSMDKADHDFHKLEKEVGIYGVAGSTHFHTFEGRLYFTKRVDFENIS